MESTLGYELRVFEVVGVDRCWRGVEVKRGAEMADVVGLWWAGGGEMIEARLDNVSEALEEP